MTACLFRTVSEINGDFSRKSQISPVYVFNDLTDEVPIGIRYVSAIGINRTTGPRHFNDIFRRLDTIHERDRQTDGRTPGDSNYRAWASRGKTSSNSKQQNDSAKC